MDNSILKTDGQIKSCRLCGCQEKKQLFPVMPEHTLCRACIIRILNEVQNNNLFGPNPEDSTQILTKAVRLEEAMLGEIVSYTMPFPDVYYAVGRETEGYVVPLDYSGDVLSARALSFGETTEECRYFLSARAKNVVEYELLDQRLRDSIYPVERDFLTQRLAEVQRTGRRDSPEYFGEYPPPDLTPLGRVQCCERIENGIYFVRSAGEWWLGISSAIVEAELTQMGRQFGKQMDGYVFYDCINTCAIPMFELTHRYPGLAAQVESMDTLYRILWNFFPTYVKLYNSIALFPSQEIPKPNATDLKLLKIDLETLH